MKKLVLVVLVAVIALGGWWLAGGDPRVAPAGIVPTGQTVAPTEGESEALTEVPLAAVEDAGAAIQRTEESAATAVAGPGESAGAVKPHPWTGELAGVRGRLVEADGAPAAGLSVALVAGSFDTLLDPVSVALPFEDLEVGRAVTDAEGRFLINGAISSNLHGLGIDLGGPRGLVKALETSLAPSAVTDVGDIALPAFGTVVGVVIDEDGEPVEGARVRLAAVPPLFAEGGLFELREGVAFAAAEGPSVVVSPAPSWLRAAIERAPVSTGRTNADGEFRLEGVPVGLQSGAIDLEGYAVALIPAFQMNAGQEHDADELELLPGREAQGRVIDGAGQAVAGAEVMVGTMLPGIEVAVLTPAGVTDEDGGFEAAGLREMGDVVVAARRGTPSSAWVAVLSPRVSRGLTVQLESAAQLRVRVVDDESGEPVSGAKLFLRPARLLPGFGITAALQGTQGGQAPPAASVELEPGLYGIESTAFGVWGVTAEAAGYADTALEVKHSVELPESTIRMKRGHRLAFRVTDAGTGEPVAGAHVSVLASTGAVPMPLGGAFTAKDGLADVGPIAGNGPVMGAAVYELDPLRARVLIQHPRYGRVSQPYPGPRFDRGEPTSSDPIELMVTPAATLRVRVTWGGQVPSMRYNAVLLGEDDSAAHVPHLALSDASGSFQVAGLCPGEYNLQLFERFLDGSILSLLGDANSVPTHRQTVRIAGEDVDLEIDMLSDGGARLGWLEGAVKVDGRPVAGARVQFSGIADGDPVLTDGSGRFRSAELKGGQYYVQVGLQREGTEEGGDEGEEFFDEVWEEFMDVSSGQATSIELDVTQRQLEFRVVDADTGEPIGDAQVQPERGESASTEPDGRASISVRWVESNTKSKNIWQSYGGVMVTAEGYGARRVLRDEMEGGQITIELDRTVAFAGTVVLPPGHDVEEDFFYVVPLGVSIGWGEAEYVGFSSESLEFITGGLKPGAYSAVLGGEFQAGVSVSFEVPEKDTTDFVMNFGGG